ncbi:MAG: hypothetical protein KC417_07580, partial [Myxococcales bacterium]|nr:hypothetical protein [Myxococcales bacterium]
RKAAEKLYTTEVPALSTFLEAKAKEAGYDRPVQMTEEPEKVEGGFRRMHTRASFSGVGLVPFLRMLAAIKNSPYPIAIERVQVEHYQKGDKYNVEVGVYAFELTEGGSRGGESKPKPAKSDEDEVLE